MATEAGILDDTALGAAHPGHMKAAEVAIAEEKERWVCSGRVGFLVK